MLRHFFLWFLLPNLLKDHFSLHSGGMFNIVEKLLEAAAKEGVQFIYSNPVRQIMVSGKKASGIILDDGTEIKADIVISNADLPYVYRKLLPDKRKSARLDRLKYSCSAICFHWGLDKIYPQLDHHNVFLSDDFRNSLDRIFKDKTVSDNPSFYVHAPARTDSCCCPRKSGYYYQLPWQWGILITLQTGLGQDQGNNKESSNKPS